MQRDTEKLQKKVVKQLYRYPVLVKKQFVLPACPRLGPTQLRIRCHSFTRRIRGWQAARRLCCARMDSSSTAWAKAYATWTPACTTRMRLARAVRIQVQSYWIRLHAISRTVCLTTSGVGPLTSNFLTPSIAKREPRTCAKWRRRGYILFHAGTNAFAYLQPWGLRGRYRVFLYKRAGSLILQINPIRELGSLIWKTRYPYGPGPQIPLAPTLPLAVGLD